MATTIRFANVHRELLAEPCRVRLAAPGEMQEVVGVLLAAYRQYQWALPWNAVAMHLADLLQLQWSVPGVEFLVAERQGRILGVALTLPMAGQEDGPRRWVSVRALAVVPAARRLGIASALLAACARRAREQRATALCLHVPGFMKAGNDLAARVGFHRLESGDFQLGASHGLADDQRVSMQAYALPLS